MKTDQKPQPKQKQTNPLVISVLGLMLTIFGIVDYIQVNKLLGIILFVVGMFLGIIGVQKYNALRASLQQKKQ